MLAEVLRQHDMSVLDLFMLAFALAFILTVWHDKRKEQRNKKN
jgi:positive regulator of sigma E activity